MLQRHWFPRASPSTLQVQSLPLCSSFICALYHILLPICWTETQTSDCPNILWQHSLASDSSLHSDLQETLQIELKYFTALRWIIFWIWNHLEDFIDFRLSQFWSLFILFFFKNWDVKTWKLLFFSLFSVNGLVLISSITVTEHLCFR